MTNSQRLTIVRNALRQWISEHQTDASDLQQPASEAMLIRDGFFCGRRFRYPHFHAVWFLEEDELKIREVAGTEQALLDSAEIDRLAECWAASTTAVESSADDVQTLSIAAHLANQSMEQERRRAA